MIFFIDAQWQVKAGILSEMNFFGLKLDNTIEEKNEVDINKSPGRIIYKHLGEKESSFNYNWKYRKSTYELHFASSEKLAKSIYGLAVFTADVSKEVPLSKFKKGVQGFHYNVHQVCDWINSKNLNLSYDESWLLGLLIADGVIVLSDGKFIPSNKIKHILGAGPGRKRSFEQNLRHERLHVFWDEDKKFREVWKDRWNKMAKEQKENEIKNLKNYNQNNPNQIIEEWAIYNAEKEDYNIK